MKIAHLWYTFPLYGGSEIWAIGLSKALRKLDVESVIVCWKLGKQTGYQDLFKVLGGNVSSSPDIIDVLMNGTRMSEHLEDYDLICAHHKDVLFPAVFSKSLHGSQVACVVHSPPMGWETSQEGVVSYRHVSEKSQQLYTVWKMFMPYSDYFFTNSKWNQHLHEKYEGISPIPLLAGVDHDAFKFDERLRQKYREKLEVDDETVLLFYSSAAGRRKRHEILLRGMKMLVDKGYNVKCVLTCSKDRMTQSFHPLVGRIIEELSLKEHILAFPATTEEILHGLYNACDIYVHPSNNEHLGMAIMEAMATRKPVIAQNNGGVPEIVENDVEGFLFKTDSIENMVKCIEILIKDKSLRETMGKNALKRSMNFDWLDVARKFLQVVL